MAERLLECEDIRVGREKLQQLMVAHGLKKVVFDQCFFAQITERKKTNGGDDDGGDDDGGDDDGGDDDGDNKSRIPTRSHHTTMGHNSSKDMEGNSILPKDKFVCLREGDIGTPFYQEVRSSLPESHRPL